MVSNCWAWRHCARTAQSQPSLTTGTYQRRTLSPGVVPVHLHVPSVFAKVDKCMIISANIHTQISKDLHHRFGGKEDNSVRTKHHLVELAKRSQKLLIAE